MTIGNVADNERGRFAPEEAPPCRAADACGAPTGPVAFCVRLYRSPGRSLSRADTRPVSIWVLVMTCWQAGNDEGE